MRNLLFHILAGSSLCLLLVLVTRADDKPELDLPKIMEKKLALANEALAGVVTRDFDKISRNADQMLKLAKTEWVQKDSPEYREQLKDFWIVVDGLKTAADEKNGDGATIAYVQMTLSCVKCHKYLRNTEK